MLEREEEGTRTLVTRTPGPAVIVCWELTRRPPAIGKLEVMLDSRDETNRAWSRRGGGKTTRSSTVVEEDDEAKRRSRAPRTVGADEPGAKGATKTGGWRVGRGAALWDRGGLNATRHDMLLGLATVPGVVGRGGGEEDTVVSEEGTQAELDGFPSLFFGMVRCVGS